MEIKITVALISALLALVGAIIALLGQARLAKLQAKLQRERDVTLKVEQAKELLSKYREPLAQAGFELQSKLYNILKLGLLTKYYLSEDESERDYAVQNTLYVIAQFFAWNEIIRQEIQFLDLGEVESTRTLSELNEKIVVSFLTSSHGKVLRVFRGEQRAIAERMVRSDSGNLSCIGYASFVETQESSFRRWFIQLEKDIDLLSKNLKDHAGRLVQLQHVLIDLLDYLDPDCVRFAKQYRSKV